MEFSIFTLKIERPEVDAQIVGLEHHLDSDQPTVQIKFQP
jgi:hypothetical protein